MSNHDTPGRLDGAIDDAVREMMALDPKPGLRHRVVGAIQSRHASHGSVGRAGGFRIGLGVAAALAVVVLGSLVLLRSPEPARSASVTQTVAVAAAPPVPPPAGAQPAEPPPAAPVRTTRRPDPAPESIFGPRAARVTATSLPLTVALPAVTGTELEGALAPQLSPGALAVIAPIALAPIRVAPLVIEPLTVNALPNRR